MQAQHIIPPFAFRRFEKVDPAEDKKALREEIEAQVKEFMASGRKIEHVEIIPKAVVGRNIRQASKDTIESLQSYIDSIPEIEIKYCAKNIKHSIYYDGVFIEAHDSRHKANQIAKRIHEAKLNGKRIK